MELSMEAKWAKQIMGDVVEHPYQLVPAKAMYQEGCEQGFEAAGIHYQRVWDRLINTLKNSEIDTNPVLNGLADEGYEVKGG